MKTSELYRAAVFMAVILGALALASMATMFASGMIDNRNKLLQCVEQFETYSELVSSLKGCDGRSDCWVTAEDIRDLRRARVEAVASCKGEPLDE